MPPGSDFAFWLRIGIEKGWISNTYCSTHDGLPLSPEEETQFDEGFDPCCFCVRVLGEDTP